MGQDLARDRSFGKDRGTGNKQGMREGNLGCNGGPTVVKRTKLNIRIKFPKPKRPQWSGISFSLSLSPLPASSPLLRFQASRVGKNRCMQIQASKYAYQAPTHEHH